MSKKYLSKIFNFTAIFEPAEEGGFTVTIPVLPGCISEGDTFEEAHRNIREAAELYLETVRERHGKIPDEESIIIAPVRIKV